MPAAPQLERVCDTCGSRFGSSDAAQDELGCMVCLLRVGLDGETESRGPRVPDEPHASFGQYRIERHDDRTLWVLGRGAMGVTYRAVDTALDRPIALKMTATNLRGGSTQARERFIREARAAAALRHPNVATVYQFGIREETGECYYAMELVEGDTLDERIRRAGPLPCRQAMDVALQVASALEAAEKCGLVHRDLKPANIMVLRASDDEESVNVKVIDFGLAKAIARIDEPMALTRGGFVGTPSFASPEQFANGGVDVRSDIYSLGATLWFAITGQLPFEGRTVAELREAQRTAALPVAQLKGAHAPRRLAALLVSMLAPQPAARPDVRTLTRELQRCRKQMMAKRRRWFAYSAAALAISAGIVFIFWQRAEDSAPPPPDKSVAVLPFENLTEGDGNAYFATGIHDDVLVSLSKIRDLKVISRNSVARYKPGARDPREIGRALHARALLEGSVRRFGDRSRINVRLIDTREGRQIWAENYDRVLADVFAVQREISESVASELNAALSPVEKAEMAQPPTQDAAAYDMYLQSRMLLRPFGVTAKATEENLPKAEKLLESAVERDPNFALAYCLLSEAQRTPAYAENRTPEQLGKAQKTLNRALQIAPDSGEVHLAFARAAYESLDDKFPPTPEEVRDAFARAADELAVAARKLPGSVEVFTLAAEMAYGRREFRRCLQQWQKAAEIDPRDPEVAQRTAEVLIDLRDYNAADKVLDHAIAALPPESTASLWRRKIFVSLARGDTKAARAHLEADPFHNRGLAGLNFIAAKILMYERNYDEAAKLIESLGDIARANDALPRSGVIHYSQGEYLVTLGMIYRATGQIEKARLAFDGSCKEFEGWLAKRPDEVSALGYHAIATAALGERDKALQEIQQAMELRTPSRNGVVSSVGTQAAMVYLWTGDREAAIRQLQTIVKQPGGPSEGELRLSSAWDELRSDPRFAAIVADAARPPNYN
jgi:serine/threonine protein kinase/Tfp pilus assembly protein PilF